MVGFEPATITNEKHGLEFFLTLPTKPWISGHAIENLNPNDPHNRPDLVVRVFDIKKKALIQDLKKNGIWGRIPHKEIQCPYKR
ncbi:hypothetical protein AVEN_58340-1 [Araneus ventricosus]|uniref:Uncharacterized protein n=1 Tax=Araneus ventricosus TaxID=182803 RepID=A0A4Y2U0J0_ARAVE|nr:hypothetical protein AVEN_58340-1 [Araneus ventricosus]